MYHSLVIKEFLSDVHKDKSTMNGSFNAGTVSTSTKGWYGNVEVWLNKKGITNLLSIPMLEAAGYLVSTHTHGDWAGASPKGKNITFKRDTEGGNRMPYIDLRGNQRRFCND
jgi:hypothetical protein